MMGCDSQSHDQIADSARVTFPAKRVAGDALLPAMCLRYVPGPGSGCGLVPLFRAWWEWPA